MSIQWVHNFFYKKKVSILKIIIVITKCYEYGITIQFFESTATNEIHGGIHYS